MVTNQNHSSDTTKEQEVIRYIEKLAQMFRLNEQNAEVYTSLSGENRALKKQLEDYHSQHNTLEKKVKRLEKDVKSLETELEDLDECVDRETLIDLIQEIVLSLIGKKGLKGAVHKASYCSFYLSEFSEDSDSDEIIEGSHRYQVREKKNVSHKQRRKV